jgi:hypothetical protein
MAVSSDLTVKQRGVWLRIDESVARHQERGPVGRLSEALTRVARRAFITNQDD